MQSSEIFFSFLNIPEEIEEVEPTNLFQSLLREENVSFRSTHDSSSLFTSIKPQILKSSCLLDIMSDDKESYIKNVFMDKSPISPIKSNIQISETNENQLNLEEEVEKKAENNEEINLDKKVVKKAPYNFGKTAIGTYMKKQIQKNRYDDFLSKKLNLSPNFIAEFKSFCLKIEYETKNDFQDIWKYKTFIGHNFFDFKTTLTKITEKFLQSDVLSWIHKNTRVKEYIPLYMKVRDCYLKGIKNLDDFDFSSFNV